MLAKKRGVFQIPSYDSQPLLLYLYHMYLLKTPWWLRVMYPSLIWRIPVRDKTLFLTFDDGPHETATTFVLDQLEAYGAKASFFCIGKNARAHPYILERIIREGHTVGNHTQNHVNGWKVGDETYLSEIGEAASLLSARMFRPPYGRIRWSQIHKCKKAFPGMKIVMWDVLSGDFDEHLTPEACLSYVLYHSKPGSIIVFHDSTKAWDRMRHALPKMLSHFTQQGYQFKALPF